MTTTIAMYDARWAAMFDLESRRIAQALGANAREIHHVGSTAVPGIYAKPIIDILVGVADLGTMDAHAMAMQALGYEVMGEFGIEGRRYYRKDDATGVRTHHVHVFLCVSPAFNRHLAFRDFMRTHHGWAKRYSQLKRELVAANPDSVDAYMDGKSDFIKDVDRRALAWIARGAPAMLQAFETDRLLVRPFEEKDIGDLCALYSSRTVMQYVANPRSLEETRARMAKHLADRELHGFGLFATILKSTSSLIGRCGLDPIEKNGELQGEAAWMFAQDHWGQGLATEFAKKMVAVGFAELRLPRIFATAYRDNRASIKVMQKVGMKRVETYEDDVEYELLLDG